MRRRLSRLTALMGYGGVLVLLGPPWSVSVPPDVWSTVGGDPEGALLTAAGLIAWCLAAWLFVVTSLVIAAAAPSTAGRMAGRAASLLTPRFARRLLGVTLGAALAVGPAGAALAGSSSGLAPVPAPVVAAAEFSFPDLDRPTFDTPAAPTAPEGAARPGAAQSPAQSPAATPVPTASPVVPSAPKPPMPPTPAGDHTVVAGDTLWDLAAEAAPGASPEQLVALWQQWYAANRQAIGADPNLLLPGQVLMAPGTTS